MTRKGKWILECDGDNECDNLYKCSMCGFECGCEEYDKPNFCPNCGTDMRIEDRVTMTREKAIQILSTRDAHGVLCGYTSGVTEALDMAIEALSKPTCTKCEDLISKEDAIQKFKIHRFYGKEGNVEFRREEIEAIHHAINSIPSREAIPCEVADKVGEENERLTDRIGQLEEQIQEMEARIIIARMANQNE